MAHKEIEQAVDGLMKEARPAYTAQALLDITAAGVFEKRIDSWYIADGSVALFRGKDGNAYEVTIRPASMAQYKGLFGKFVTKRSER